MQIKAQDLILVNLCFGIVHGAHPDWHTIKYMEEKILMKEFTILGRPSS